MTLDEALNLLIKERLENIQLVEDFIDDFIAGPEKTSKLNRKIKEARILQSSPNKREILKILNARKSCMNLNE